MHLIDNGFYHYHDIKEYRREAIKTAEELGYSDSVIAKIKTAETDRQITDILAKARRGG